MVPYLIVRFTKPKLPELISAVYIGFVSLAL